MMMTVVKLLGFPFCHKCFFKNVTYPLGVGHHHMNVFVLVVS